MYLAEAQVLAQLDVGKHLSPHRLVVARAAEDVRLGAVITGASIPVKDHLASWCRENVVESVRHLVRREEQLMEPGEDAVGLWVYPVLRLTSFVAVQLGFGTKAKDTHRPLRTSQEHPLLAVHITSLRWTHLRRDGAPHQVDLCLAICENLQQLRICYFPLFLF